MDTLHNMTLETMTGAEKVKILEQHIWVHSSDRILQKTVNTDVKEQDVCVTYI